MNSKKPRNRENRTRSIPAEATVTVHMLLPRSAYEEMRQPARIRKSAEEHA